MTRPLSPVQQRLFDEIRSFIGDNGFPPTVRELAGLTGQAVSTVHHHLSVLEGRGFLHREPTKPRTIVIDLPEENDVASPPDPPPDHPEGVGPEAAQGG